MTTQTLTTQVRYEGIQTPEISESRLPQISESVINTNNTYAKDWATILQASRYAKKGKYEKATNTLREYVNSLPRTEETLQRRTALEKIASAHAEFAGLEYHAGSILTEEEEKKFIESQYNTKYPGCGKTTKALKIREVQENCALLAHKTSPVSQAVKEGIYATMKSILVGGIIGGFIAGERMIFKGLDTQQAIALNIIPGLIPTITAAHLALLNVFGDHPFSAYGNYFDKPYFSILDHLKFCANWLKISKWQNEGKIRKKEPGQKTSYEGEFYNIYGGP